MKPLPVIVLFIVSSFFAMGQSPDLVILHAKIFTADSSQLYAEAMAIKDGRIMATGSSAVIAQLAGGNTKKIDAGGRLIVPGFNDTHNHLPNGLKASTIQFNNDDPSWAALVDSVKIHAQQVKPGEWIMATIGISIANNPAATRFVLDAVAPAHPVILLSWWGHVGLFNTAGLQKMGIAINQPDPKGGFYERMPDGKTLTGKAFEKNAYWPHTRYAMISSMKDETAWVQQLQGLTKALLRDGITSYQNMCTGANAADFARLWKKAGLPFRLRLIKWADMNQDGSLSIPSAEIRGAVPGLPLATVSGTKWLLEGTPLEQGAEEIDPYPGTNNWHGRMNYSMKEVERMCRDAMARNDQLHFHLGGSRSMEKVMDLMLSMKFDWKALRPRFEHGDEIDFFTGLSCQSKAAGHHHCAEPYAFCSHSRFTATTGATITRHGNEIFAQRRHSAGHRVRRAIQSLPQYYAGHHTSHATIGSHQPRAGSDCLYPNGGLCRVSGKRKRNPQQRENGPTLRFYQTIFLQYRYRN